MSIISGDEHNNLLLFLAFQGTKEQWQTIFLSTGCLYMFGLFIFLVCGSGELQPWAKDDMSQPRPDIYGPPIVADGKRASKLYMDLSSTPDGDLTITRDKQGRIGDIRMPYQTLEQQCLPANATANKQSLPHVPQRQGSVAVRPRSGLVSGRIELSPYATLPRSRAEVTPNSPTSGSAPIRPSRRLPDIEGYPTLRKNADLSNYQPPFRKSLTQEDSVRQLLIPPQPASGSGLTRKTSKTSKTSKDSSRQASNRNSRNSAEMGSKRISHADASAYIDLSESIV